MEEILIFYAFSRGVMDQLDKDEARKFEKKIFGFLEDTDSELALELKTNKVLTDKVKEQIDKVFLAYFDQGVGE